MGAIYYHRKKLPGAVLHMIVLSELRRGTVLELLEGAVEVGYGIETAIVAYLRHTHVAGQKQMGGMADADARNIVAQRTSRMIREETAEGSRCHVDQFCHLLQCDVGAVMGLNILSYSKNALIVARDRTMGEGTGGKNVTVVGSRQVIEDGQDLEETVEAWLHASQHIEIVVNLPYSCLPESDTIPCILEQACNAGKIIAREQFLGKQIRWYLDGYLVYIIHQATSLLPGMHEVAADKRQVINTHLLYAVAYQTACPFGMLNEVEFYGLVLMQGIGERSLGAFHNVDAVLLGQRGDFGEDIHGLIFFCKDSKLFK